MASLNILIKPASASCNMACKYCFYKDVAKNRQQAFKGILSLELMKKIIQAGMEYPASSYSFTFQGGEPTIAGLDFFRQTVKLQKEYARPNTEVFNAIQTNGYLIDEAWAEFLAENHFLVGLSLDGPAELHNLNRVDVSGNGTFNKVMHAAKLLKKYHVDFNILCVVTGRNARAVEKIYHFYKKQGFRWLQFIPALEPIDAMRGMENYYLSANAYGDFLIRLFDLWYADLRQKEYISIRHLDNWLSILMGARPEACDMAGRCAVQFVVEGDGSVYPCDFYVLDEWYMGKVGEISFAELQRGTIGKRFINTSLRVPAQCQSCPWHSLCRNGCRRDRMDIFDGGDGRNCYCESFQRFFSERKKQMIDAIQLIYQIRTNA